MKQTAIEWLVKEIEEKHNFRFGNYYWAEIKQAKEMFEEQIQNAYWDGGQDVPVNPKACESYYNETYKNNDL